MKIGKIKYKQIDEVLRLDGSYHLSDAVVYENVIKNNRYEYLSGLTSEMFTAGRSKRIYTDKEYGIPYLSNSDMVSINHLDTCKYVSKKFSYDEKSFLKKGMVLTGRVGAIGQVAYVRKDMENAMGSDNIIRIVTNEKTFAGYIYAFFSSKIGYAYLWKLATGGVQPYISEDMLKDLPIPLLPEPQQQHLHHLIEKAAKLREDANRLLREAEEEFTRLNDLEYDEKLLTPSENEFGKGFLISRISLKDETFKARNYSFRVSELIKIWNSKDGSQFKNWVSSDGLTRGQGGFFKRIDDRNVKGMDIISQSDLHKISPTFKKVIKKANIKKTEIASKGMIILPSAGTLGENEVFLQPELVYKNFEGKILSEVIGKLRCRNIQDAAYLFIALKSKVGFRILRGMVYGTNLMYPRWDLLKEINIPMKNEEVKKVVSNKVISAYEKRYEASTLENQAIIELENTITSWQN